MSASGTFRDELIATAKKIATPGKGILAADESTGTIGKRLEAIKLENNEANRRAYRQLLFTTPGEWQNYISGVIFYEETLDQSTDSGKLFVDVLREKGIIPGIKVDMGTANIPGTDDETFTQGLDKLTERCKKYYQKGARFSKWRAVLKIDTKTGCPTDAAIHANAYGLAAYGAISQSCGLVPII
jgi:fructose-bisphosphate aldolase class I